MLNGYIFEDNIRFYCPHEDPRLNTFANETHLINEAQIGFKKGYCTLDNIYFFEILCKYAQNNQRKLFCALWQHTLKKLSSLNNFFKVHEILDKVNAI